MPAATGVAMDPPSRPATYNSVSSPHSEGVAGPPSAAASERADAAGADRELVRRMAAGEEGALGALYDRWSPLVHSLVVRCVKDANDAEDVVEETFWQAWRQAARYDSSRASVSTWLVTMARSRALDRVRALRRSREEPLSQLVDADAEVMAAGAVTREADDRADPQHAAELSERRAMVAAAIGSLPPEQRETITLAYFGGLSQSEIAGQTGQPLGTVKTRTRLAMERLRTQLAVLREGLR